MILSNFDISLMIENYTILIYLITIYEMNVGLSLPEANSWHQWFSIAAWIVNSIYLLELQVNMEFSR